ncbi:oligopeptide transport system permease protein [Natranaerovirga pectinivora]|uniref:Oligopeptide transport system permease protein n=1 Tax=Natranaerovirga pectinivora TaxID=682400 RepID=A0A4V2UZP8_9FIRM|nr:ABC transporter permease [Natranaerovirga pectinivora]TCT12148.1 oligopeptide transport system permease protein [Natranaerovirga pectinivora]
MLRYISQRLFYGFITLFIIISITFLLLQFMPGTPFKDDKLSQNQIRILNEKYGLDEPFHIQYINYMGNVLRGDFGVSFTYDNQEVFRDLILPRLPVTIKVGALALFFGTLMGIFLGALSAIKRNTPWDHLTTITAIVGVSVPSFVFATLLQYWVGVRGGWLPVIYVRDDFRSLILPAISLSVFVISSTARFMRTELVEVLSSDYTLLAKAKGLSNSQVIKRHSLRNALIPVITILGPMTITLLTGSVVVERIFGIAGVSFLLVEGITRNDYFVILGVAAFYSFLYISVILIVDILYGIIDPRIRLSGGK